MNAPIEKSIDGLVRWSAGPDFANRLRDGLAETFNEYADRAARTDIFEAEVWRRAACIARAFIPSSPGTRWGDE